MAEVRPTRPAPEVPPTSKAPTESPSVEASRERHANRFEEARPRPTAPSVRTNSILLTEIDTAEKGGAASKVIPIDELHIALADEAFNRDEPDRALFERVIYNVQFSASWFPEETRTQFDATHKRLTDEKREAGPALMAIEATYAPNAKRLLAWVAPRIEAFNEAIRQRGAMDKEDINTLNGITSIALSWKGRLPPDGAQRIEACFRKTLDIIEARDFRWNLNFRGHTFVEFGSKASVAMLAGAPPPKTPLEEKLTDAFFARDPEAVLADLDEQNITMQENLPEAIVTRVWNFLVNNHASLYRKTRYWNEMRYLLQNNPEFVSDFIARTPQWFSLISDDSMNSDEASDFYIYSIYTRLLVAGSIPEASRREVLMLVLQKYDADIIETCDPTADVSAIERRIVTVFLQKTAESKHISSFLDDIAGTIIHRYAKEWEYPRLTAFIRNALPHDQLEPSFTLLNFMAYRSKDAAQKLLNELADPSQRSRRGAEDDPLWRKIWLIFGGGILSGIFENACKRTEYDRALERIPNLTIEYGMKETLDTFYRKHHPYAAIYALPKELRPTAAKQTFVSIDGFPDPEIARHPDKKNIRNLPGGTTYWENPKAPSHGFGVSSLAVGEKIGLAPEASLTIAPIDSRGTSNLPLEILDALERTIEADEQGEAISVVGISLGMEVPNEFQNQVARSPIYRKLVRACTELHRRNIAVVISAGNSGAADQINILGMLPHVTLAGALESHLTRSRTDDTESSYSTGAGTNALHLWAHADPVLFPFGKDQVAWLKRGGTSSAQPHLSGALLLMRDVNPLLTADQSLAILEATADPSEQDATVQILDPMEALAVAAMLPGSTYRDDRRDAFLRALEQTPGAITASAIHATLKEPLKQAQREAIYGDLRGFSFPKFR